MDRLELRELLKKKYHRDVFSEPKVKGAVSSGSILVDIATGIGGFPLGSMIEVFGPFSSGKSLLCLKGIATAQKLLGKPCAYFSLEGIVPDNWLLKLGVDLSLLDRVTKISSGEEAFEIMIEMLKSNMYPLIVVDSLTAMAPKKLLEGNLEDGQAMGLSARMISTALSKINPLLVDSATSLIFVSQVRSNLGGFRVTEDTPSGKALKFYCSQRWRVSQKSGSAIIDKETKQQIGHIVKFKVLKNKLAPPMREAEFDVSYSTGTDNQRLLIKTAKELGIITKGAAGGSVLDTVAYPNQADLAAKLKADFTFERALHERVYALAMADPDQLAQADESSDDVEALINESTNENSDE